MKKNLQISVLMTVVTTVLLGLVYPLVVTALAQLFFRDKANGQLVQRNGTVVASRIIAQPFVGAGYFHPRPSAAGNGYDATASAGSNRLSRSIWSQPRLQDLIPTSPRLPPSSRCPGLPRPAA